MSDTVNFLKKFHEPFKTSWPPKMKHYQNEETRNRNFKNLCLNIFLTKLFDVSPSIYDNMTNWDNYNLENFDSISFFTKNLFLVTCFHVCS